MDLHDIAGLALRNLARDYYAKAVGLDNYANLSIEDMVRDHPYTIPMRDGRIWVWDDTMGLDGSSFMNWRLAALYETMAAVQELLIGDDGDVYDMAPDGMAQMVLLADPDNVDWLELLLQGQHAFNASEKYGDVHFMDATSNILWAQVEACDDEDCDIC